MSQVRSQIFVSDERKPTVVSLFAGCGGSSLGYKLAGYDCRLAVEWDDNAAATYRLNFPATTMYHGDVAALTDDEALRLARVASGELDVLDGSPPCQGFSTVGKRVMDDPRNSLFRQYVRLLRAFRPRAFVMENVSGMVKGKMLVIFAEIVRELKSCGYRVSTQLLNAMYFGVPQARQRVIIIGVREDLNREPSHPRAQTKPIAMRDALPSLGGKGARLIHRTNDGDYYYSTKPSPTLTVGHGNYTHFVVEHPAPPPLDDKYGQLWPLIPPGKSAEYVLTPRPRAGDVRTGFSSCVKPNPGRPCMTLPKTQTGRGFATVAHPTIQRALTIEEAKIIGSFPPEFQFVGTYSQQWARIGNSVPPLLMRAVAAHIKENILMPSPTGK